jgi:hypothetical protein
LSGSLVKKLLHEPLVHFAILGALLFAAWEVVGEPAAEPGRIVVTQAQIEALERGFAGAWHRPPTAEELDGLIGERVREEVWYRQAVALGLDRDDPVVRRRLRQKMEFLADEAGASVPASEAELGRYLQANADRYRIDRTFSFLQVFLNPAARGDGLARDAADLLAELDRQGADADLSAAGDPFLLEREFVNASAADVAQQFGDDFVTALTSAQTHRWFGPIASAFGRHLVFIRQRDEGRLPPMEEVRAQVLEDWQHERRRELNEEAYRRLLAGYEVAVERAGVASGKAAAATGAP